MCQMPERRKPIMKMTKITTENQISVHDFPEGSFGEQNQALRNHIGPKCELYEHVMPKRLYSELCGSRQRGNCVSMLIDEDGHYHELPENLVASWLYESDKHGYPILGNVLIVGEKWEGSGISFCEVPGDQFDLLFPQLRKLTEKARKME